MPSSGQTAAFVNRIIPFSSVDGPGNRTAVFLQGCNWNCQYCHNPETRGICNGCGKCVSVCPRHAISIRKIYPDKDVSESVSDSRELGDYPIAFKPELCVMCDACIKACPHSSCPRVLRQTPEQTFEIIKRQMPFIRGVTVSGGECCLYPEYLVELFKLCKEEKLETMIDSNGSIDFRALPELVEVTDGFMLDIKAFDSNIHLKVTGADNKAVIENITFLADKKKALRGQNSCSSGPC